VLEDKVGDDGLRARPTLGQTLHEGGDAVRYCGISPSAALQVLRCTNKFLMPHCRKALMFYLLRMSGARYRKWCLVVPGASV
jgi:hypothetical protein